MRFLPDAALLPLKKLGNFLIFTSFYLAFCAVGMVYLAYQIFHLPVNLDYLAFTFFGTLCSYNFHWLLTPHSYSGKGKAAWSVRNKGLHLFLLVCGLAGAAYFGWQLLSHWRWLLATAFLTFLYSAPMIPHAAAKLLQRIAIGKTLFLSLAWTHVTALLPLVLYNNELSNGHIFYVVNRFFLIYGICVLFDYRDREQDIKQGIRSVITAFAPEAVLRFFWGVMIAFFLYSGLLLALGFPIIKVLALFLPGVLVVAIYDYSLRHPTDYMFYGLLDGLMALSLPLLLLFQAASALF